MNSRSDLLEFLDPVEEKELPILDRTKAENYAHCPAMARFIEAKLVNDGSTLATVGNEVHDAFGEVVRDWISSDGQLDVSSLVESFDARLRNSRPDVQTDVLNAGRYAGYRWASYVRNINPHDIMRYDGGHGERSGQLAIDYEDLGIRYTSEVDFLCSSPSAEVLDETDYKSGWKVHTLDDIASSFQFQSHAVLVLTNYPQIDCLRIRVWNVRSGGPTYWVEFPRKRMLEWETRIRYAADRYLAHRDTLPQAAEAWPSVDKCPWCPAAIVCPAVGRIAIEKLSDPVGVVDELHALDVRADALRKFADVHIAKTGKDIVTPAGIAYGTNKPKANRKPTRSLYTLKPNEGDTESE